MSIEKSTWVIVGIANIAVAIVSVLMLTSSPNALDWLVFIIPDLVIIVADIVILKNHFIYKKMNKDKAFREKMFKKWADKEEKRDEEWRKKNWALQRQKIDEYKKEEEKQNKLAHTTGREKYDMISLHERDAILSACRTGRALGDSVYQEKENDWAIIGGFAEGLAGPAAGVAAAMNAIQDNARIQRENEERKIWGEQMIARVDRLACDAMRIYRKALTDEYIADFSIPTARLFSTLSLETKFIETDRLTKAVRVAVNWKYSSVTVDIDGSFCGILYSKDGKCAGEVYFSLPKQGTLAEKSGCIYGICAEPIKSGPYTVKYEPINLWKCSIEKGY